MHRSTLSRLRALLILTAAGAGAGCVHPRPLPTTSERAQPAPIVRVAPTPAPAPVDELAFYDLTQAFGLQVSIDLVTGRRVCKDAQNEVVVMPSTKELVINGTRHPLSSAIRWRNGVLCLPGDSRALLAEHLRLGEVPDVAHDPDVFDGSDLVLSASTARASAPRSSAKVVSAPLPKAWAVNAKRPWQYIVIHHSATDVGDAKIFHREHAKKWQNGLGYHFVIGNGSTSGDGEIEVGTRWLRQGEGIDGAHAGNKRYNKFGIGICLVGEFDNGRPSPRQLVALRRLCRALMSRYGIPRSRIFPHSDVRKGTTHCPGKNFPLNTFVRSL